VCYIDPTHRTLPLVLRIRPGFILWPEHR